MLRLAPVLVTCVVVALLTAPAKADDGGAPTHDPTRSVGGPRDVWEADRPVPVVGVVRRPADEPSARPGAVTVVAAGEGCGGSAVAAEDVSVSAPYGGVPADPPPPDQTADPGTPPSDDSGDGAPADDSGGGDGSDDSTTQTLRHPRVGAAPAQRRTRAPSPVSRAVLLLAAFVLPARRRISGS